MKPTLFDALTGEAELPRYIEIGGAPYLILTDFRFWARFESAMFDTDVPTEVKDAFLLAAFQPSILAKQVQNNRFPFTIEQVAAGVSWFLSGAAEKSKQEETPGKPRTERGYDFIHDISHIYSAFRSVYNINLIDTPDMHWWVFRSLFFGLPADTVIKSLISERTAALDKKATRGQKDRKALVALPENIRWFAPIASVMSDPNEWVKQIRTRREAAVQAAALIE
jgi:hypothetical protein